MPPATSPAINVNIVPAPPGHKPTVEEFLADLTPAEMYEEPSCDQVLGVVCCRDLIANTSDEKSCWSTLWNLFTVTPLTNITPVSLWYQAYLNVIFHRTNFAFYGHATTMPLVVLFLCAYAASYRYGDATTQKENEWTKWIDMNFFLCCGFFIWYTVWGCCFKIWWFGPCSIPILVIIYLGAHYYHYEGGSDKFHPLAISAILAFIQSFTHLLEDLPPRVSGTIAWTLKSDFACRDANHLGEMLCRSIRMLAVALISGPIDEWIASPRLLPLFWSLWPVKTLIYACGCSCCGTLETMERYFGKLDGSDPGIFKRCLDPAYRVECKIDDVTGAPVAHELDTNLNSMGRCCQWFAYDACCEEPPKKPPALTISNPALDYIGIGGGTFMTVDRKISCADACCGRYKMGDIQMNRRAGALQNAAPCETSINPRVLGVSGTLPGTTAGIAPAPASIGAAPAASHAPDASANHAHAE